MLQEIRSIRQDDPDRTCKWFQDDFFDLFTWVDKAGEVVAFQLCYDRLKQERVLAWSGETGFLHRGIDDGEFIPSQKMAPIMIADGVFEAQDIHAEFASRSEGVDPMLRNFMLAKIDEASLRLANVAARQGRQ